MHDSNIQSTFNTKKFKRLKIENLNFHYSKNRKLINNFSLEINSGDKILINGPSGSGKTSLIDVLIGIKRQLSGNIYIDDKSLSKSLFKELKISYIPQDSYLIDDTIKKNITFPVDKLDLTEYNQIINLVGLKELISSYSNKDDTQIGERGFKISGGQKQRNCIARIKHNQSRNINFEQATNALDIRSENLIIKNIIKTYKNMTVMIISHRNLDENLFNKTINLGEKI